MWAAWATLPACRADRVRVRAPRASRRGEAARGPVAPFAGALRRRAHRGLRAHRGVAGRHHVAAGRVRGSARSALPLPGRRASGSSTTTATTCSSADAGRDLGAGPERLRAATGTTPRPPRAALTADGWLRTGDIAVADDDGYLYLVDRAKDLIIVSGFNVYPGRGRGGARRAPRRRGRRRRRRAPSRHRRGGEGLRGRCSRARRWTRRTIIEHCAAPPRPLQVPDQGDVRRRAARRARAARSSGGRSADADDSPRPRRRRCPARRGARGRDQEADEEDGDADDKRDGEGRSSSPSRPLSSPAGRGRACPTAISTLPTASRRVRREAAPAARRARRTHPPDATGARRSSRARPRRARRAARTRGSGPKTSLARGEVGAGRSGPSSGATTMTPAAKHADGREPERDPVADARPAEQVHGAERQPRHVEDRAEEVEDPEASGPSSPTAAPSHRARERDGEHGQRRPSTPARGGAAGRASGRACRSVKATATSVAAAASAACGGDHETAAYGPRGPDVRAHDGRQRTLARGLCELVHEGRTLPPAWLTERAARIPEATVARLARLPAHPARAGRASTSPRSRRSASPSWPASTPPRCARTSPTSAPTAPAASATTSSTSLYQISRELGLTHDWPVVIVGVGNLGQALANYGGFGERGFPVAALVDADAGEGRHRGRRRRRSATSTTCPSIVQPSGVAHRHHRHAGRAPPRTPPTASSPPASRRS